MARSGEFAAGSGAAPGEGQMYMFGPRGGAAKPGSALTSDQADKEAEAIKEATAGTASASDNQAPTEELPGQRKFFTKLEDQRSRPTAFTTPRSRTSPGTWTGKGTSSMEVLAAAANLPDGLSKEHEDHIKTQLTKQFGADRMGELIPHMVRALPGAHRDAWHAAPNSAKAPLYGGVENFEEIHRISKTPSHPASALAQHLVGHMSGVAQQAAQSVIVERSSRSITSRQKSARTRNQGTQGFAVDDKGNYTSNTNAGVLPGTDAFGNASQKAVLRAAGAQALHQDIIDNPTHRTSQALFDATNTTPDTLTPGHLEHYLGDLSKKTGHLGLQVSANRLVRWDNSGSRLDNHPTGVPWSQVIPTVKASQERAALGKSDTRPDTPETNMVGDPVGPGEGSLRMQPPGAASRNDVKVAQAAASELQGTIAALQSSRIAKNSDHIRAEWADGKVPAEHGAALEAEQSAPRSTRYRHEKQARQHLTNLITPDAGQGSAESRGSSYAINQDSLQAAQRIAANPGHAYHREAKNRLDLLAKFQDLSGGEFRARSVQENLGELGEARRSASSVQRRQPALPGLDAAVSLNRGDDSKGDVVGTPTPPRSPSTQAIESADPTGAEDAMRSLGNLVTPAGRKAQEREAAQKAARRSKSKSKKANDGGSQRKTVTGRNTSQRR